MPDPIKTVLRNTIKPIRTALKTDYKTRCSKQICTRLGRLEAYRRAKHIGIYYAVNGEVDLSSIWESAPLQGKFCYFPALTTESKLLFLPATPVTSFKENKYRILEPDVSPELARDVEQLDLIILPLVAFDSQLTRLGMGAGYYDRTLSNKEPKLLIGLAYSFQKVSYIEASPWDIPLHMVITPNNIYTR